MEIPKRRKIELTEHVLELIRRTSTDLPEDVLEALEKAYKAEEPGGEAERVLAAILENIKISRSESTPICQDTGTLIFHVGIPFGYSMRDISEQIKVAVAKATELSYLRPNSVDSLTGKNPGNNLGIGFPTIEFEEWENETVRIDLMLKGGGCENVGAQYSLPMEEIQASRDLEGVKKVVLHGIHAAQGMGCAPGIIGVGIGGDRSASMLLAKRELFRKLTDKNPIPELAALEEELLQKANKLKIGPMGFGGATTCLGVQIGVMHRIPASFFVSIAYMCWADRRRSMFYTKGEVRHD